jgi:uncharacterized protein (TIGR04255 family)
MIPQLGLTRSDQGISFEQGIEERILFLAPDRKTFAQVGQRLMGVNRLAPYESWERFRPAIDDVFVALSAVVPTKAMERVGLRYINRIQIPAGPESQLALEQYFSLHLAYGDYLPALTHFNMTGIFSFLDGQDECQISLSDALPDTPQTPTFMLDIDYYSARPQSVPSADTMAWVDQAHNQLDIMFEGSITDRLRLLFQEPG